MLQPKDGKNQLDSQALNFTLKLLRKKFINKIKFCRRSPDPDFLGFCPFPDACGQLKKTKTGRFEADELAVTWEKIFEYLERKDF